MAGPLIRVAGESPQSVDNSYVKPESLIPDYESLKNTALQARYDEERDWVLAWSYYKGRHWVTWREDRLEEIERQDLPKMVLNFVMSIVQTRLGHLSKNRPMWVCIPSKSDEESRNATKIGLKVLEGYHRKLRMGEKVLRALLWMLVPGLSYLKLGWDPSLGGTWEQPLSTGQNLGGPLGDVFCDIVKPHEILPEPGADDLEGTQRLIHQTYLPIGQVLRRYPHLKGKIEPVDINTRQGQLAMQNWYGPELRVAGSKTNRVEVSELFYRSGTPRPDASYSDESGTGLFEQGLRAVIVNGKEVAEAGPVEEGMPEIPFVRFSEIPTDGYYPTSTARQLLHVNKILDVEFSQNEYNRKVLRPKTLVPYQAHIKPGAWDQSDDEVVEYYHPYKPEAYSPPALPSHHQGLPDRLISLMDKLAGNADILAGKTPPETRSGRMVSYLQEFAGTVLGVTALNVEYSYDVLGNMLLSILRSRVREERLVPLVGRGRQTEIVNFIGTQLEPIANVAVQTGSALPVSRVEKQDRIEKWMEKGWLPPEKGLLMLDVADPDSDLFRDDEQDRENADEVIQKLRAITTDSLMKARIEASKAALMKPPVLGPMGQPMPQAPNERDVLRALGIEAFEFDNHDIMLDEVNKRFRKTGDYRKRPKALRAIADAYCDWQLFFKMGLDPDNPQGGVVNRVPGPSMMPVDPTAPPPPTGPGMPESMPGGIGGPASPIPAESGQEAAEGLPPVRQPRGPGRVNR